MSPLYNSQATSNSPLVFIYPGDTYTLFNAESPLTGQSSIAVYISNSAEREVNGLALELVFSANPGTFNFRIQGSDSDADSSYFTEGAGTVTTATQEADGTYRMRVELSPWVTKFMRLNINMQTQNNVTVTARVTSF